MELIQVKVPYSKVIGLVPIRLFGSKAWMKLLFWN